MAASSGVFLETLRTGFGEGLLLSTIEWNLVFYFLYRRYWRASSQATAGKRSLWDSLTPIAGASGGILLYVASSLWKLAVDQTVPDPYLDEVFHVPQALRYCQGRYHEWDDKITTPPGLYALSVLHHRLLGCSCTVSSLRHINRYGILLLAYTASLCRQSLEARPAGSRSPTRTPSLYADHTGISIALFPVLFFFSALYYTDVLSALAVLVSYQHHLRRVSHGGGSGILSSTWTIVLGVAAVSMRQTNVFWVVAYMGGSEVVHVVRSLKPPSVPEPEPATPSSLARFYLWRYSVGDVHDPPLNTSQPIDWISCVVSIAIAAACNPVKVLKRVWPHVTIMGLFAGFVAWNGGVVLGDKSNHVATLHLAQMLYIWPFFAFFSAPLLLPVVPSALARAMHAVSSVAAGRWPGAGLAHSGGQPVMKRSSRAQSALSLVLLLLAILTSIGIVKYNTIVHPFTLADNRHYMFYVFRYTILRSAGLRLSLVGAYAVSAWLVWTRLAGCLPSPSRRAQQPQSTDSGELVTLDDPRSAATAPPPTSTALLWLLTTSLSLVTAPLVEPRYFILPWVFWRLLVPAWPAHPATALPGSMLKHLSRVPGAGWACRLGRKLELSVAAEALWFLLINAGSMYMFLFRPYVWRSGDGELLDGGKMQRFMW